MQTHMEAKFGADDVCLLIRTHTVKSEQALAWEAEYGKDLMYYRDTWKCSLRVKLIHVVALGEVLSMMKRNLVLFSCKRVDDDKFECKHYCKRLMRMVHYTLYMHTSRPSYRYGIVSTWTCLRFKFDNATRVKRKYNMGGYYEYDTDGNAVRWVKDN